MHETLNKYFIGYIDTNEDVLVESSDLANSEGKARRLSGWVVDLGTKDFISAQDIKVVDLASNGNMFYGLNLIERPDVYQYYATKIKPEEYIKYQKSGFEIAFKSIPGTYAVVIRGVPVFNVTIAKQKTFSVRADEPLDSVIKPNGTRTPDLIVVDNFYEDPDKVRDYALQQEFKHNEKYHKGARTERRYIPSWVQAEFSRLLNREVTEFVGATGVFQYCVAKDNVVYHYDTQQYAAMVYLSPDAPLQTGTRTLKSKITGLISAATDEDAKRLGKTKEELDFLSFNGNNFYDVNNFEFVDTVANVYNRLVIFNAQALHAATGYYGDTKENSRLFHLYFFNVK
jgi:hypothetical protein